MPSKNVSATRGKGLAQTLVSDVQNLDKGGGGGGVTPIDPVL